MKKVVKIVGILLALFLLIQLIPVDYTNPPIVEKDTFEAQVNPSQEVESILRNSCYDCHSNQTVYPDYAKVAPISWSIKNHVNEGREYANFSIWGTYNKDIKTNILKKSIATIKNGKMPMKSYVNNHPNALMTQDKKELMIKYFDSLLVSGDY